MFEKEGRKIVKAMHNNSGQLTLQVNDQGQHVTFSVNSNPPLRGVRSTDFFQWLSNSGNRGSADSMFKTIYLNGKVLSPTERTNLWNFLSR